MTHSVARSQTALPPGSRPQALRVTIHDQQVATLGSGEGFNPYRGLGALITKRTREAKEKYTISK